MTRTLIIRQPDSTQSSVTVTKADYVLDPVSDRYGAVVIPNTDGRNVGYINLRTFIVQNAGDQLRDAIDLGHASMQRIADGYRIRILLD